MLVLLFSFSIVIGTSGFPVNAYAADLPIFPGAHGFGTDTRAAYGGSSNPTVYRVTNLNSSGSGSLRQCIEGSGPESASLKFPGRLSHRQTWWPVSRI